MWIFSDPLPHLLCFYSSRKSSGKGITSRILHNLYVQRSAGEPIVGLAGISACS